VVAAVESHFRETKVHVFKKKVRKRYSKLQGHRSQMTALRILQVRSGDGKRGRGWCGRWPGQAGARIWGGWAWRWAAELRGAAQPPRARPVQMVRRRTFTAAPPAAAHR
jgi:hypothetical protein